MSVPSCAWSAIPPSSRVAFAFPGPLRADGTPITIPVLTVQGSHAGPTLLVTAGVHGDEFEGMLAIWRVYESLIPAELHGTFVGVPIANPPAYEAGLRTNPDDRQDLARVFPGDRQGTVTEQLAHLLTERFLRHADLYCDLHSAGQYYAIAPLAGYQLRSEPLLSAQRQAARAFGLPLVWGTPVLPGRSLSAAGDLGIPAIYAEVQGEGRCRAEDVARHEEGIRRLLAHLRMIPQKLSQKDPEWLVEDDRPEAGFLQMQNRAPLSGFFESKVVLWEAVTPGQPLGQIRTAPGTITHLLTAACTGRVAFLRTFPRVLAGDPLCTLIATADINTFPHPSGE